MLHVWNIDVQKEVAGATLGVYMLVNQYYT